MVEQHLTSIRALVTDTCPAVTQRKGMYDVIVKVVTAILGWTLQRHLHQCLEWV